MIVPHGKSVSDLNFNQLMLAGSLAGLVQMVLTYPLETARVRLTLDLGGFSYRGITHCISHTVQREGFGALYKVSLCRWWLVWDDYFSLPTTK